jgi:hypothetical protein
MGNLLHSGIFIASLGRGGRVEDSGPLVAYGKPPNAPINKTYSPTSVTAPE